MVLCCLSFSLFFFLIRWRCDQSNPDLMLKLHKFTKSYIAYKTTKLRQQTFVFQQYSNVFFYQKAFKIWEHITVKHLVTLVGIFFDVVYFLRMVQTFFLLKYLCVRSSYTFALKLVYDKLSKKIGRFIENRKSRMNFLLIKCILFLNWIEKKSL